MPELTITPIDVPIGDGRVVPLESVEVAPVVEFKGDLISPRPFIPPATELPPEPELPVELPVPELPPALDFLPETPPPPIEPIDSLPLPPRTQIEAIPTDRIDDPVVPMRSQMDEEKLDELARSIRLHGLIQPITLRVCGDRYEVVAGHRRFKACKRAGIPIISAIIRALDDAETDEVRMHENLYREDINPVDEARYICKMIDTHKIEPEKLAEMTGKSEAYLRARYDLLSFPDYLVKAIEAEEISLTAGSWLNKIENDSVRKEYTKFGILGGITARRAEAWYRSWMLGSLPREASAFEEYPAGEVLPPKELKMICVLCQYEDNIENMGMHYAHLDCVRAATKMSERASPGF